MQQCIDNSILNIKESSFLSEMHSPNLPRIPDEAPEMSQGWITECGDDKYDEIFSITVAPHYINSLNAWLH